MQKKRRKEKLIGVDKMRTYELVPNRSLGIFILGDKIDKYLALPYEYEPARSFGDGTDYETYYFFDSSICVWTENNRIGSIDCDYACYWKGKNLIGMLYDDFISFVQCEPDSQDSFYVPINADQGRNQMAYVFFSLGLTIWVWRKKIRSVVIDNYEDE